MATMPVKTEIELVDPNNMPSPKTPLIDHVGQPEALF